MKPEKDITYFTLPMVGVPRTTVVLMVDKIVYVIRSYDFQCSENENMITKIKKMYYRLLGMCVGPFI